MIKMMFLSKMTSLTICVLMMALVEIFGTPDIEYAIGFIGFNIDCRFGEKHFKKINELRSFINLEIHYIT